MSSYCSHSACEKNLSCIIPKLYVLLPSWLSHALGAWRPVCSPPLHCTAVDIYLASAPGVQHQQSVPRTLPATAS